MLTIASARGQRFCDGISRHDFLRAGALGFGGLSLADLLRLRARADPPARPKSVIMVYLTGGPSHIHPPTRPKVVLQRSNSGGDARWQV